MYSKNFEQFYAELKKTKLTATISIRIPEHLKLRIEDLDSEERKRMNARIIDAIGFSIYEKDYDGVNLILEP